VGCSCSGAGGSIVKTTLTAAALDLDGMRPRWRGLTEEGRQWRELRAIGTGAAMRQPTHEMMRGVSGGWWCGEDDAVRWLTVGEVTVVALR
jgi:hypothetical protein